MGLVLQGKSTREDFAQFQRATENYPLVLDNINAETPSDEHKECEQLREKFQSQLYLDAHLGVRRFLFHLICKLHYAFLEALSQMTLKSYM